MINDKLNECVPFPQRVEKIVEEEDEDLIFQLAASDASRDIASSLSMRQTIDGRTASLRLDKASSILFPSFSRTMLEKWIEEGAVRVNGVIEKKRYVVKLGDEIIIEGVTTKRSDPSHGIIPFDFQFDVLYEDDDLFVINKPPGIVVHPAPGNWEKTVVNGLVHRFPDLQSSEFDPVRPGIVHRLDKDTSGVLIIAKNPYALWALGTQFQKREVYKEYTAIVSGAFTYKVPLRIETLIGRDRYDRKKMAVVREGGKEAISEVISAVSRDKAALVKIRLLTGRTHQIRVHLSHIGHPIIGDSTYGCPKHVCGMFRSIRQMLHCYTMRIWHPRRFEQLVFTAPLSADMIDCLQILKI